MSSKSNYVRSIALLGRLIQIYGIDIRDGNTFDDGERELLEQAARDFAFFHPEEKASGAVEAGTKRKPGRPPSRI
jgi:hypothetical protein